MKRADKFNVEPVPAAPGSGRSPRAQLLFDGKPTGTWVDGAVLEQQFDLPAPPGGWLLFLTGGVPYEETLHVWMVSPSFRVADGLEFGAAYATGSLEGLAVEDGRTVSFGFVHKRRCRLRVAPQPRWRSPLWATPGVRRTGPPWRKGWLSLRFV